MFTISLLGESNVGTSLVQSNPTQQKENKFEFSFDFQSLVLLL